MVLLVEGLTIRMKCIKCGIDKNQLDADINRIGSMCNILFDAMKDVPVNGTPQDYLNWTTNVQTRIAALQ